MSEPARVPFTRAVGTVRLASEFLSAARLQDLDATPPTLVAHFLLGHALELAFKSVLIAHGTSDRILRTLGHDLAKTRDAAMEVASTGVIELDPADMARLNLLSPYYEAKALEYLEPGFMRLPVARELMPLAERLIESITRSVEDQVRTGLREGRAG